MGFAQMIADAFSIDESRDSIRSIKQAIAQEIVALDPQVKVKTTEYFNHSYVPDLVAVWPSDSVTKERYIYLKFNSELAYLFDDLTLVQDHHPIIFGLAQTPHDS